MMVLEVNARYQRDQKSGNIIYFNTSVTCRVDGSIKSWPKGLCFKWPLEVALARIA